MTTIADLLTFGQEQLNKPEAKMESQLLLAYVLQCERAVFYTWPEKEVSNSEEVAFKALIEKRLQGEPIAYLLEEREFWSLPFKVSSDTLIPRHETEILVEKLLSILPPTQQWILELGTGCGAVACALAHERPAWQIVATDISLPAVEIAQENAKRLALTNIQFSCGKWFEGLAKAKQFSAIVSNPPYIQEADPHLEEDSLPYEPFIALVGGETGFESYITILADAADYLKPQGFIIFEHGYNQAEGLQHLLQNAGFTRITTFQDYRGLPRVTMGYLP